MLRLLYARAINNTETAVVIETQGQLLGGIAVMTHMTQSHNIGSFLGVQSAHAPYRDCMELHFTWVWNQVVDSVDWFEHERAWEHGPQQAFAPPMKLIGKD